MLLLVAVCCCLVLIFAVCYGLLFFVVVVCSLLFIADVWCMLFIVFIIVDVGNIVVGVVIQTIPMELLHQKSVSLLVSKLL